MSRQLVRIEIGDQVEFQGDRFVFSGVVVNGGRRRPIFTPVTGPAEEVPPDVLNVIRGYLQDDDTSSRVTSRRNGTLKQVREVLESQGLDPVMAENIIASIIESGLRFRQKGP